MSISRSDIDEALGLPFAHGGPVGRARFKLGFEDFIVEEKLRFVCSGEGEHLFLRIRKRGCNTQDAAMLLARFAGVQRRDVGFAGLKDKIALAEQWFSIRLPKIEDQAWDAWADAAVAIVETRRHHRKLKRGALAANRFRITLRALEADRGRVEARLAKISETGVPNYFGPQRFGHDGANLRDARLLFAGGKPPGRHKRAMLLSAARAFLFNRILACRVAEESWNRAIPGDALMFDASKAYFQTDAPSAADIARIGLGALHPSGVLWGLGGSDARLDAAALETRVLQKYPPYVQGLEQFGLEAARRALRVIPRDLHWRFDGPGVLLLDFELPGGAFATSVLREVLDCRE